MVLLSQHATAICTTQLHALLIREGLMLILFSDDGWRIWENVFSLNLPRTPCASTFRRITFMKRIALIRSRRQHRVFSSRVGSIQFLYLFASVCPCTRQWMHNVMRQTLDAIVLPCHRFRKSDLQNFLPVEPICLSVMCGLTDIIICAVNISIWRAAPHFCSSLHCHAGASWPWRRPAVHQLPFHLSDCVYSSSCHWRAIDVQWSWVSSET